MFNSSVALQGVLCQRIASSSRSGRSHRAYGRFPLPSCSCGF